jgi:glycosyltransferase involved in cell wall biosynthesis
MEKEPRVLRSIGWLSDGWSITTLGLSGTGIEGVRHLDMPRRVNSSLLKIKYAVKMILGLDRSYYDKDLRYAEIAEGFKKERFDLIVTHDYDTLPLAFALKSAMGGTPRVMLDAHEFATRQHDESLFWRIVKKPVVTRTLNRYLPATDSRITVCEGIADEYLKVFGKPFKVVNNASRYFELDPSPGRQGEIRIALHGGAGRGRMLECVIDAMRYARPEFKLDLVLVDFGSKAYLEELKERAKGLESVRFLPPVPFKDIVPFLNGYDVGIASMPASNFNQEHALPNKFFEFIQARLALIVGPLPEMASVVRKFGCGIVADDHSPKALARALNGLDAEKIKAYKAASAKAAKVLCAEENRRVYLEAAREALAAR